MPIPSAITYDALWYRGTARSLAILDLIDRYIDRPDYNPKEADRMLEAWAILTRRMKMIRHAKSN